MQKSLFGFLLLLAITPFAWSATPPRHPQKCFQIRGRAVLYRGDGFFAIWHVGTHHIFFPADKASADLLCSHMDCDSPRKQPALFADLTICPTRPFRQGWAQPAIVKKVTHFYVVPEWPPKKQQQNTTSPKAPQKTAQKSTPKK